MVDFAFNIRSVLRTFFWDFCEPDSETLTSGNNQLARGVQSKSVRGLGAEPTVVGMSPQKPKIAQLSSLDQNPFQKIAHLFGQKRLLYLRGEGVFMDDVN